MSTVRAAGGVVTRPAPGGGTEVLVVHRRHYDDWSLPKGKCDPGEHDEDAAVREVLEETGYRCVTGDELPAHEYRDRAGRPKRVRWWRMTVVEEVPWAPDDEVAERRWVPTTEAMGLLTYRADRDLVATLGAH